MKILPILSEKRLSRIFRITVCGFQIIGLAPFSLQRIKTPTRNPRHTRCTNTFLFSKIGMVYNILLLILVLVMSVLAFPQLAYINYPNKSFLTQFIDLMHGIIHTSTSCVVILFWALKQKTGVSIMNRLLDVNCLFSGMEKHATSKRTSIICFIVYVIFNAFLWATAWVSSKPSFDSFPNWFVANVPLFVINWFVLEYSILLGIVAAEFESLNKNLLNLKELPTYSLRTPLLNDYLTILQNLPIHNQLPASQLLHSIRTSLYEVSLDITEFFSFPILPCIACLFLTLVSNIYYLVIPVVIPVNVLALTLTNNVNTLVWTCICIYPLILLAVNVTEILKEIQLTGLIVHSLLGATKKRESKLELERFSLQLLHENVNFAAYGFFALDFTLIQSIVGATATYLVIIIQFMRSSGTGNDT